MRFKVGDFVTPATPEDASWCKLNIGEIVQITGFSPFGNVRINGGEVGYFPYRFNLASFNKSLEDYM